MNPAAVLALIGELYAQVATLTEENKELKAKLAESPSPDPQGSSDAWTFGAFKVYPTPDGKFSVAWGGQWLGGSYDTIEAAVAGGQEHVANTDSVPC